MNASEFPNRSFPPSSCAWQELPGQLTGVPAGFGPRPCGIWAPSALMDRGGFADSPGRVGLCKAWGLRGRWRDEASFVGVAQVLLGVPVGIVRAVPSAASLRWGQGWLCKGDPSELKLPRKHHC